MKKVFSFYSRFLFFMFDLLKKQRKPFAVLALAVLPLLVSCGHEKPGPGVQRPVVEGVRTAEVRMMSVPSLYQTSGQVESKNSALVASKVMGTVTSMRVDRGQAVRKGQVLLTIEAGDAREKVAQAGQGLAQAVQAKKMADEQEALARTTYGRYKKLYDQKALSQQEFDEMSARLRMAGLRQQAAGAAVAQARAALAEAKTYLGYTVVRAPISGIVLDKKVDTGSMATPGAPLIALEEPSYRISASLDERLLGKVRKGTPVMVDMPAAGGRKTFPITQVTPGIDPATRTFNVKIALPYSAGLQSGLYVKIYVPYGQRNAVMVPEAAVGRRGQLQFAYAVGKNGVLELRALRTGQEYDGYVEVLSGLSPGERVTASGFEGLSEGDIIKEAQSGIKQAQSAKGANGR